MVTPVGALRGWVGAADLANTKVVSLPAGGASWVVATVWPMLGGSPMAVDADWRPWWFRFWRLCRYGNAYRSVVYHLQMPSSAAEAAYAFSGTDEVFAYAGEFARTDEPRRQVGDMSLVHGAVGGVAAAPAAGESDLSHRCGSPVGSLISRLGVADGN